MQRHLFNADYDYYHTNSVEIIPENEIGTFDERFKKGNIVLSFAAINSVFILDKDSFNVTWAYTEGLFDFQHTPSIVHSGNLILFDNGRTRNYSRVLEINPLTKKLVWNYTAEPKESFHSKMMGVSQRLPNGKTLIAESTKGRVS